MIAPGLITQQVENIVLVWLAYLVDRSIRTIYTLPFQSDGTTQADLRGAATTWTVNAIACFVFGLLDCNDSPLKSRWKTFFCGALSTFSGVFVDGVRMFLQLNINGYDQVGQIR